MRDVQQGAVRAPLRAVRGVRTPPSRVVQPDRGEGQKGIGRPVNLNGDPAAASARCP